MGPEARRGWAEVNKIYITTRVRFIDGGPVTMLPMCAGRPREWKNERRLFSLLGFDNKDVGIEKKKKREKKRETI